MALIEEFFRAQGRAEQAAKDKAAADALAAEYSEAAAKPLSVDEAISRLRARARAGGG